VTALGVAYFHEEAGLYGELRDALVKRREWLVESGVIKPAELTEMVPRLHDIETGTVAPTFDEMAYLWVLLGLNPRLFAHLTDQAHTPVKLDPSRTVPFELTSPMMIGAALHTHIWYAFHYLLRHSELSQQPRLEIARNLGMLGADDETRSRWPWVNRRRRLNRERAAARVEQRLHLMGQEDWPFLWTLHLAQLLGIDSLAWLRLLIEQAELPRP
jgi:hypothetical protein